ncbi:methyltransferase domain-containing protein [Actinomadura rubrisoli]|uniref:Methyltransferase domain-containing protein n=1 Tax=Actinomadura rubrisoli TaxID=2530368 RepID=A0A4R5CA82_9ACTN|nr:methyltransferase domain-containing protein [Actinomadura rubrisoli]TDD96808.1 methyltransferase domain-containing protein [Actinomadura rubrisoli]
MHKPGPPNDDATELTGLIERHRSAERPRVFTMLDRDWDLLPEVYAPVYATSTSLFTRWLRYPSGGSMLEVGCGAGLTAVTAALAGCRSVTALDINPAAVDNTRLNAERHGVADRVRVLHSDMFEALDDTDAFDLIFWNSNFVEAPADAAYPSELARAFFDPGYDSHERYLAGAGRHLRPGGRLYLGFSDLRNRTRLDEIAARRQYRIDTSAHEQRSTATTTVEFQLLEFTPLQPGTSGQPVS